ncbi:MAG TPA: glycosyltransferase [Candidatus Binatia bacterium]|jgi:glycosyltransferase involved in cell wall biosynthesis|nr:glycosyltransferase [Candidatus Binatia bacterium]
MPRVSVVLATRNQARWLPETLASVRAQTFDDWELLVADDGSTDDTATVLATLAGDARLHLLPGKHMERAAARNRALAQAKGRYVAFLDGDDCWHPDKLARQVAALDAQPDAAFCYTIARFVDADGVPLPHRKPDDPPMGHVFPRLVRGNVVILASVMARRDHVERVGAFDATLPVLGCEDWDLWLRLSRHAPVIAIADELTRYRRHAGNTAWEQVLRSGLAVLDRLYADPAVAGEAGLTHAAARARHLWYHATIAADGGRSAALALAASALRESPRTMLSRPALGTLAALLLPRPALRSLGRLPA